MNPLEAVPFSDLWGTLLSPGPVEGQGLNDGFRQGTVVPSGRLVESLHVVNISSSQRRIRREVKLEEIAAHGVGVVIVKEDAQLLLDIDIWRGKWLQHGGEDLVNAVLRLARLQEWLLNVAGDGAGIDMEGVRAGETGRGSLANDLDAVEVPEGVWGLHLVRNPADILERLPLRIEGSKEVIAG